MINAREATEAPISATMRRIEALFARHADKYMEPPPTKARFLSRRLMRKPETERKEFSAEELANIKLMYDNGISSWQCAKLTGRNHNTVAGRYLRWNKERAKPCQNAQKQP